MVCLTTDGISRVGCRTQLGVIITSTILYYIGWYSLSLCDTLGSLMGAGEDPVVAAFKKSLAVPA